MPRPTYGPDVQNRVKRFFDTLLSYAADELDDCTHLNIEVNWQTEKHLVVRTKLRILEQLTAKDRYNGKLTKAQITEALKRLEDFLGILQDNREHSQGSEDWHFTIELWHGKDKEANLKQFDSEWENRKQQKSKKSELKKPVVSNSEVIFNQKNIIPSNIPRSGVTPERFFGRSQELSELHQQLQQNGKVAIIAAIAGMGGVGKTELAIQYAIQHLADYPGGVCWIPAKYPDVGIELVSFARSHFSLNPPDDWDFKTKVNFCWQNWQPGEVLLLIDDVTNYEEIQPYLPPAIQPRFKVLMTTRIQRLGKSITPVPLKVLDEASALELLISLVGEERMQKELNEAKKLCQWLEFLPLGLELVGRYLDRKPDLSLAEMRQRLEEKRLNEKSLNKREQDMTAKLGVKAAFELSWETLNDEAKELGCLLSLFAPAAIPWYLVEWAAPNREPEDLEEIRDDILSNLHLIQRTDEKAYHLNPTFPILVLDSHILEQHQREVTYRVHQLVREFMLEKLKGLDQVDELKRNFASAIATVAQQIPSSPTNNLIPEITPIISHLIQATKDIKYFFKDEDLVWPFIGICRFYQSKGLYDSLIYWSEQCLSATKERFISDHPQVAVSMNNLAKLYSDRGRYCEAKKLLEEAIEMNIRLIGLESTLRVANLSNLETSVGNLAHLYQSLGYYKETELLLFEALDIRLRLMALQSSEPIDTLVNFNYILMKFNNLATLYYQQGRYEEAEDLLLPVIELKKVLVRKEHREMALLISNLAQIYSQQGRYQEAEALCIQALEINRRLWGDNHLAVATALNNLAAQYHHQGRDSDAQAIWLKSLQIKKQLMGENHPDVATTMSNIAHLYCEHGYYKEAKSLYIKALKIWKIFLGDDHPNVATILNNLGGLHKAQRRYKVAERLFWQALKLRQSVFGNKHRAVANIFTNLAMLYEAQGSYKKAEELYIQAIEIYQQQLGEDHSITIKVSENLKLLRDTLNLSKAN